MFDLGTYQFTEKQKEIFRKYFTEALRTFWYKKYLNRNAWKFNRLMNFQMRNSFDSVDVYLQTDPEGEGAMELPVVIAMNRAALAVVNKRKDKAALKIIKEFGCENIFAQVQKEKE